MNYSNKLISQIFISLSLTFCVLIGSAQTDAPENSSFVPENGWSINGGIGLNHYWGDLREYDYYPVLSPYSENRFGFSLSVQKEFFSFLSIGLNVNGGKISGQSRDKLAGYKILFFKSGVTEGSVEMSADLMRLIKPNPARKWTVLLNLSHGMVFYKSQVFSEARGFIEEFSHHHSVGHSTKNKEQVTSYGLWFKYKLTDKWHIGAKHTLHNVWNDELDGWTAEGSANDKYSFTGITISRVFSGKKRKSTAEPILVSEPAPEPIAAPEVIEEPTVVEEPIVEEPIKEEPIVDEPVELPAPTMDFSNDVVYFNIGASNPETIGEGDKRVAEKLKSNPNVKIKLVGYTDSSGGDQLNLTLSKQRADWFKSVLVSQYGIDASRIETEGKGSSGTNKEIDPKNRKVEIIQVK